MDSLPIYIMINNQPAYLQCGAFEDGWFMGYFQNAPTPIFTEAHTLKECIRDLTDILLIRDQMKELIKR